MRWTVQDLADYESRRMQKRTLNSTVVETSRPEAGTDKVDASPSKYKNKKTEVDGIVFASKKEAGRYTELKALERTGYIRNLKTQVPFVFAYNDVTICRYYADFQYETSGVNPLWRTIVEDVKGGKRTKEYIIKKKLMRAFYGIEIFET